MSADRELRRPRPRAVAGRNLRSGTSSGGGWRAAWDGADTDAPSEFWVPPELRREATRVLLDPGEGAHRLPVA